MQRGTLLCATERLEFWTKGLLDGGVQRVLAQGAGGTRGRIPALGQLADLKGDCRVCIESAFPRGVLR